MNCQQWRHHFSLFLSYCSLTENTYPIGWHINKINNYCCILLRIYLLKMSPEKTQEMAFPRPQISKFSEGACPQTPLEGAPPDLEILSSCVQLKNRTLCPCWLASWYLTMNFSNCSSVQIDFHVRTNRIATNPILGEGHNCLGWCCVEGQDFLTLLWGRVNIFGPSFVKFYRPPPIINDHSLITTFQTHFL